MAFLKMSLCRGRFGLSLGFLFKRLQSGEQGMDTSKIPKQLLTSCVPSIRTIFFAKQMANLNGVNHFSPSLFLCPPSMGPPFVCTSHPPTVSPTSCTTAVWPRGQGTLRFWRSVPARPSRCRCCFPTCWLHQPSPRTCCCSLICPAGMSSWSKASEKA